MQKIAVVTISPGGEQTARVLTQELGAQTIVRQDVPREWNNYEAFVFVGAMGICVRTIAPLLADKHTDPAVVCTDATGRNAIAVAAGHVGGANELAERVAAALGAHPVITTQSDNIGLWALDLLPQRYGWTVVDSEGMNECIFRFVNKRPTALLLDINDAGTDYLRRTMPPHVTMVKNAEEVAVGAFELVIAVSPFVLTWPEEMTVVQYVPKVTTVGIGLAHEAAPADMIVSSVETRLREAGLLTASVREYCSIDVKANEPVVALLKNRGMAVRLFAAEQLAAIEVPNPSKVVEDHVGTPSVCEASAIMGADAGQLVMEKRKGENYTVAAAISDRFLTTAKGHVEIVGAGPGDPELVSVRGRRLLEQADLILYAGSLVPRELTLCHKEGAVVRSSASMTLEEQCALMKEYYDRGCQIVRLHTGDPCIFGAIQEQMAFFDKEGMHYHITPGISSFLAAAAELRSQFTIPQRTQTIILTRGEGRTPMPEREQLSLLARSQSTMCIFLSAAIVDDVQRELLKEYPEDTPVAACYHLTWPDQRIFRGRLKDLAAIVHDHHLTLTTMLVVGEAIDNRQGLSELYSSHFAHLYRKAKEE